MLILLRWVYLQLQTCLMELLSWPEVLHWKEGYIVL